MLTKTLILGSVLLFSACAKESSTHPYVLKQTRTVTCQAEIEQSIASLINVKSLTLSKDVFSETSFLYLTNRKNGALTTSPIVNDLRGRKTLKMYQEKNHLFIGLLNKEKEVVKFEKLVKCSKN